MIESLKNMLNIILGENSMRVFQPDDHTFAICAYQKSCFLEKCICSIMSQKIKSNIIITTSTWNRQVQSLADIYRIPLFVNPISHAGMAGDWNFAYQKAATPLVTICHQDDLYHKNYLVDMLKAVNTSRHPLLYFTNYNEIRGEKICKNNLVLDIKRLMLLPLSIRLFRGNIFVRRRILSLGCPICCPTVTYVKQNICKNIIFTTEYKSVLDWQAWEKLSALKGDFIYSSNILLYHRIHSNSSTTIVIDNKVRTLEEKEILRLFWPQSIASVIEKFYSYSQKSNKS